MINNQKLKNNSKSKIKIFNGGLSLLEIMVAVTIFAVLGVVMSRSILLTLRGARKSESIVRSKENVSYAMSVIERNLRNADSVICPNTDPLQIDYTDEKGRTSSFSCVGMGTADPYIASSSARLTGLDVDINECSFSCARASTNTNPTVSVSISASDKNASGIEGSTFSSTMQVVLRSY